MEKIRQFLREHQWTVTLIIIGLILASLLFTIGLWKTLLLFAIVGVAWFFGSMMDKKGGEGVKDFFAQLFNKRSGDK